MNDLTMRIEPPHTDLEIVRPEAACRMTDWAKGEIAGLLEARHAADLPTIVTSNLSPRDMAAAIDPRVASRISESRMMLKFPSRDLRTLGDARVEA